MLEKDIYYAAKRDRQSVDTTWATQGIHRPRLGLASPRSQPGRFSSAIQRLSILNSYSFAASHYPNLYILLQIPVILRLC